MGRATSCRGPIKSEGSGLLRGERTYLEHVVRCAERRLEGRQVEPEYTQGFVEVQAATDLFRGILDIDLELLTDLLRHLKTMTKRIL